jgi:hypothetical protein
LGFFGLALFTWDFTQRPEWYQKILSPISSSPNDARSQLNEADQLFDANIDAPQFNTDRLITPPRLTQLEPDAALSVGQEKSSQSSVDNAAKQRNQFSLASLFGTANATSTNTTPLSNGITGISSSIGNLQPSNATNLNNPTSANQINPATTSNPLSNALNRYSYSPAQPNPNAPFPVKPDATIPVAPPSPITTPSIAGSVPLQPAFVPPVSPPIAGTSPINPALLSAPSAGLNSYTSLINGAIPTIAPIVPTTPISSNRERATRNRLEGTTPAIPGQVQSPISGLSSMPMPSSTILATPQQPTMSTPTPVEDLPFTAPRSIPGRSIGAGQINTFSNP